MGKKKKKLGECTEREMCGTESKKLFLLRWLLQDVFTRLLKN